MNLPANIEMLGSPIVRSLRSCMELATLFVRSGVGVLERDYPKGEIVRQMHTVGNKSVIFICVTMGFLGMVMVMQSGQQINQITGDLTQLGPEFLRLFIQELAPSLNTPKLLVSHGCLQRS